jgi:hypothetical protein
MVLQQGQYSGTYWDEGYLDKDLRCGLDLLSRWPDKKLPKGKDHILLMMCFRDDLNGHEAARPFANDYRSPDRLAVTQGDVDKADDGDADADGYNEVEGCYVLKPAGGGLAFTLCGAAVPRFYPTFKVKGWTGTVPESILLDDTKLAAARDFIASKGEGSLLVQLLRVVKDDVKISVR